MNDDLKVNPTHKKYIITFKRKDLRPNKTDDKVEIMKSLAGLGDFENYVNISELRPGDKYQRYNKAKTGRNETDRFNPIAPNYETVHDINRYDFPVVMMKLTPAQYHLARKDPNIALVEEETYRGAHSAAPPQQIPSGIERLKAPQAWTFSKKRGEGVGVGIIDSGVEYTHPDLTANWWGGITFVPGTANSLDEGLHLGTDLVKLYYHGTHIAGTIGAYDNQEGVVGVAPKIKFYSIRIFSPSQSITGSSLILQALQYCMQNNFDITNNSYGGGPTTASVAEKTLFQQAADQGMICCCSSGNDGRKNMDPNNPSGYQTYPAGYPSNIEVTAIDATNNSPAFANCGTKTEFAAPGVDILSTWTMAQFGGYTTMSGTSMSCPHIVGAFAMGLSAWRFSPCSDMYHLSTKKQEVIRTVVRQTCDKLGKFADKDPTNTFGYGVPNVLALTNKLLNPDIHIQPVVT